MKKLVYLFASLALVIAACGGDSEANEELPINDNGATPAIDAACLVGEPDCNDTPGGEPTDLPPPGDDSGEPLPAAMPIADAVTATGPVAVNGFLVVVDGEARICEALAESFPPQCGGASVTITSYDQVDPDDLQNEGEVTWTDYAVTIFGEMVDGTLVATSL